MFYKNIPKNAPCATSQVSTHPSHDPLLLFADKGCLTTHCCLVGAGDFDADLGCLLGDGDREDADNRRDCSARCEARTLSRRVLMPIFKERNNFSSLVILSPRSRAPAKWPKSSRIFRGGNLGELLASSGEASAIPGKNLASPSSARTATETAKQSTNRPVQFAHT